MFQPPSRFTKVMIAIAAEVVLNGVGVNLDKLADYGEFALDRHVELSRTAIALVADL
jgi:hypothetical protein